MKRDYHPASDSLDIERYMINKEGE